MELAIIKRLETAIRYCFYTLFLLSPLILFGNTSELFEFNKTWFIFYIALAILFFWGTKVIITKEFHLKRTPLDIPLGLFLLSQIISTIFSLDSSVSFWGYYSRFNGGLLSTIVYIFLYYAFVSNITSDEDTEKPTSNRVFAYLGGISLLLFGAFSSSIFSSDFLKIGWMLITAAPSVWLLVYASPANHIKKILFLILTSGVITTIWGLPSHFGLDPTCLMFRGSLDVSCWTEAFQPKIRIFSTLGQPNWLAAFLAALIPVSFGFGLETLKHKYGEKVQPFLSLFNKRTLFYALVAFFMYLAIIFTRSQSGFLGLWVGLLVFIGLIKLNLYTELRKSSRSFGSAIKKLRKEKVLQILGITLIVLLLINFFIGFPVDRFNSFTFSNLFKKAPSSQSKTTSQAPPPAMGELGGTDSGKIRLIVWRGALEIFKRNPIIGTGVETYAFAYYQVKPKEHNLTSEWDFLYNKAHNEYLNYLATTGILGLGTYLSIIGLFLYFVFKKTRKDTVVRPFLAFSLPAGYITILVSNFFGFSVVNTNLLFFFLPLLFFYFVPQALEKEHVFNLPGRAKNTTSEKILAILSATIILFLMIVLLRYWLADKRYALGNNLDHVGEYSTAYPLLVDAVKLRPGEPTFQDELSTNMATLALLLEQNNEATQAAILAGQAKSLSDRIVEEHPNNVVFYKTRTRVLFTLSEIDSQYLPGALQAIERARELAPTDAKILYNQGLLYQQAGKVDQAIEVYKKAIALKPDYRDAYYSLALLETGQAKQISTTEPQKATEYREDAKKMVEYILKHISKGDKKAQELLDTLQ